jgi:hypothetical protein
MFPLRAPSHTQRASSKLAIHRRWTEIAGITLDRVVGVGLDSRGRIYLAHRGEHPVLRLHPDGSFDREIGAQHLKKSVAYDLRGSVPIPMPARHWMHCVHVDPWDNLWLTDVSRHLVFKFSPEAELLLTLGVDGVAGCDAMHFFQPTHVCVLPSGEFFVTDGYGNSRIAKFGPNGRFRLEWGRRGTDDGEFHTPHVITLGADGLLYMADRENDRIQVFKTDGTHVATWPDLHSIDGLIAAPDGFLFGSSGIDGAILRLDLKGRVLDCWALNGQLAYPHGIAVARNGDLWVAETGDLWELTGRLPSERALRHRNGAERSALTVLRRTD